ncbi:hypothetical protein AB0H83_46305 [Dactylosporangium sp. NPDC050688]|uniref:hypothetical protein n=1 Tax=Dactylosporangium sp. NPDC050688 TaxID=3157217 RepID=UPI0033D6E27C
MLTAAHAVRDAESVVVRFDAGMATQWSVAATVTWAAPHSDVALLAIDPPAGDGGVAGVSYGRLVQRSAQVPVRTAGFPRWKVRGEFDASVPTYRELHEAHGLTSPVSNRRSQTIEITVPPPADDPEPGVSPWEGMSGSAVWVSDRIVGVVIEHHRREGLNRLCAVRIEQLLDGADAQDRQTLADTIGLRHPLVELDGAVPAPKWWFHTGYVERLWDLAPADGLADRETELEELAAWCAGDEPYVWWQAGPWAGKTALMSWFVLHPPPDTDVVSFFITARFASQSDSASYTEAVSEQLAALLGESVPPALSDASADAYRRAALRSAIQRAEDLGRTLVLLVDALDEDRGHTAGARLPSIASLLPGRTSRHLRVIVSSRAMESPPDDVESDHPLRSCRVRELEVSAHARAIKHRARTELGALLRGDDTARSLLALITAAGGGLTQQDMEMLTGLAPYEVQEALTGPFGRTVTSRVDPWAGRSSRRVHLFAHETLREEATERLGEARLSEWRSKIKDWADGFEARDWPADAPMYLLRDYPRILDPRLDLDRLVRLAMNPHRQDRLLDLTGGDTTAMAEIRKVQLALLRQPEPQLRLVLDVAIVRQGLALRNEHIPIALPAVWAALGHSVRAENLALSIPGDERRLQAVLLLAKRFVALDQTDLAERIALDITELDRQAEVIAAICSHLGLAGRFKKARQVATGIALTDRRAAVLTALARAAAASGDRPAAADLCEAVLETAEAAAEPVSRARVLTGLVAVLLEAGDPVDAERVARGIALPAQRDEALQRVVEHAYASGDADVAFRVANDLADGARHADAVLRLVGLAGERQDWPRLRLWLPAARTAVSRLPGSRREQALAALTGWLGQAGDFATASALIDDVAGEGARNQLLARLSRTAADGGQLDPAERFAADIPDPHLREEALTAVVEAAAAAGRTDRVHRIADLLRGAARDRALWRATGIESDGDGLLRAAAMTAKIADSAVRAAASVQLLEGAVSLGDDGAVRQYADAAIAAAQQLNDPGAYTGTLTRLLPLLAGTERRGKVEDLLERAYRLAGTVARPDERAAILTGLVPLALRSPRPAGVGRQIDTAAEAARFIVLFAERAVALERLASTARAVHDIARSDALRAEAEEAAQRGERHGRTASLCKLATTAAGLDPQRAAELIRKAEALARTVPDADLRLLALREVAAAMSAAGDDRAARRLEAEADALTSLMQDTAPEPSAMAVVAVADAVLVVRSLANPYRRAVAFAALIRWNDETRAAASDLLSEAELAAGTIGNPALRDQAYGALATAAAWAALYAPARLLALRVADTARQAGALTTMATLAADAGHFQESRSIAAMIANVETRAEVLTAVAECAVRREQPDLAGVLAHEAEALARTGPKPERRAAADVTFARAAVAVGNTALAMRLVARAVLGSAELTDGRQRDQVLMQVVEVAGRCGEIERARELAMTVDDRTARAAALAELVRGAVGTGRLDHARGCLPVIEDPYHHALASADVADAAARAGDHDTAQQVIADIQHGGRREEAQAQLARTLAAGNVALGRHIAAGIQALDIRDRLWADIARIAATAGDTGTAQLAAGSIADGEQRAATYTALITAGLADLDGPHLDTLLHSALSAARSLRDAGRSTEHLARLLPLLTGSGRHDTAQAVAAEARSDAEEIFNRRRREEALGALVDGLCDAGLIDTAADVADALGAGPARAQALVRLGRYFLEHSDKQRYDLLTDALDRAVADIRTVRDRSAALIPVAELALAGQQPVRARQCIVAAEAAVATLDNANIRESRLTALIRVAAALGDRDITVRLARKIRSRHRQVIVLDLVEAAEAASADGHSEELASCIDDATLRVRAWVSLATAANRAGDTGRTERLLSRIGDSVAAARVMSEAALRLSDEDPSWSRRLVSMALTVGDWTDALVTVAHLDPEAFRAAAHDLLDGGARQGT